MDLTTLSLTELKALGFDQLKQLQIHQNNITLIDRELQRRESLPIEAKDKEGEQYV